MASNEERLEADSRLILAAALVYVTEHERDFLRVNGIPRMTRGYWRTILRSLTIRAAQRSAESMAQFPELLDLECQDSST